MSMAVTRNLFLPLQNEFPYFAFISFIARFLYNRLLNYDPVDPKAIFEPCHLTGKLKLKEKYSCTCTYRLHLAEMAPSFRLGALQK